MELYTWSKTSHAVLQQEWNSKQLTANFLEICTLFVEKVINPTFLRVIRPARGIFYLRTYHTSIINRQYPAMKPNSFGPR